jgi:carbon starvation protein CstA
MRLDRLRPGEWIAAAGGLALLVTLFLPWFEDPSGESVTAWSAFGITDVVLALLGAAAIGYLVLVAASPTTALPTAINVLLVAFAAVALLLVLFRTLINQPGDDGFELGALLGLAATIVTLAGAWHALADESSPGVTVSPPPAQPAPPAT